MQRSGNTTLMKQHLSRAPKHGDRQISGERVPDGENNQHKDPEVTPVGLTTTHTCRVKAHSISGQ